MKLLFVGNNCEHPNDMHFNYRMGFQEVCKIEYYGPGYTSNKILENGIGRYIADNNIDAVIVDFSFMMLHSAMLNIRDAYAWHRYTISNYGVHSAIRYANRFIDELELIDIPKIIYYWFDTYTIKEKWIHELNNKLSKGWFYLGPGIEFFPEVKNAEYMKKAHSSNIYRDFCLKNEKTIISMCEATIEHLDMWQVPLVERTYDITIPGNLDAFHYPERARIESIIRGEQFLVCDDYAKRTLAYLDNENVNTNIYKREIDREIDEKLKCSSVYIELKKSKEAILLWREKYKNSIRNSKMAYSCGAVSRQLLRKFVEIPCAGTLLLCEDIPSLSNYGFIDGENVVVVNQENVVDLCNYYLEHLDIMQKIADAGRKMVLHNHTSIAHCKATIYAIQMIMKNEFRGSYWENGSINLK